jgi:hypothetical protein
MIRKFLEKLFKGKQESHCVLIWLKDKLRGGTSYWFINLAEAAEFAKSQAGKFDVYYGIGLASHAYGKTQRVKADEIIGIPCIWLEVDYKTGSTAIHKKEEQLPTKEEAIALINELPFKPSLIVNSGNGFHLYWLLTSVWLFADAIERERAKLLVERFQRYFKSLANAHGWTNDSTFDLARVYRVPGTKNHKTQNPKPVTIVEESEERYTADQIENFLDSLPEAEQPVAHCAEGKAQIKQLISETDAVALDPHANVPVNKFDMLCEAEPKFRLTWEKKRKDLPDQSASSYDMALADYAALAQWTDQEIANLIIAFRRKHGDDLKLRYDYYAMTIAKARKVAQSNGTNNRSPQRSISNDSKAQAIPPPELRAKALYGLPGMIVQTISPHTEAHPAALLIQFLVAFSNCIGRTAYFTVEATRHYLILFAVIVGISSRGRKGTSWDHVSRLFQAIDEQWCRNCMQSGLSSGEGLIYAVRDPVIKREPIKEKGRVIDYQDVITDVGVLDKRLLAIEEEFAKLLRVIAREGNTLSPQIRQAWDKGNLRLMTKNSPLQATDAHVSIIGHITKDELKRNLDEVETANGFANRFLWTFSRRTKLLPEGGNLPHSKLNSLILLLHDVVNFARSVGEMSRDKEANALWHKIYGELSTEDRTGLFDAVTSRAEAQVSRLACIYALLDQSAIVQRPHLEAALALWCYCEDSARFIFGNSTGDRVADAALSALREAEEVGLTKTDISTIFARNVSAARLNHALTVLESAGRIRCVSEPGESGRPVQRFFAVFNNNPQGHEGNEINEIIAGEPELSPDSPFNSLNSFNSLPDADKGEIISASILDGNSEIDDLPF